MTHHTTCYFDLDRPNFVGFQPLFVCILVICFSSRFVFIGCLIQPSILSEPIQTVVKCVIPFGRIPFTNNCKLEIYLLHHAYATMPIVEKLVAAVPKTL